VMVGRFPSKSPPTQQQLIGLVIALNAATAHTSETCSLFYVHALTVFLCHVQKDILEDLLETATHTAGEEVKELPTRSHCAMCACSLTSANSGARRGAAGKQLIHHCNTCEELLRRGVLTCT
jgi:hypothetical protein